MDFPQNFKIQSTEQEDVDIDTNLSSTTAGVVDFLDETEAFVLKRQIPQLKDAHDFTPNVELGDFLSRPVKIATLTWEETSVMGSFASIGPWYSFFNDTRIKYKVNNYAFIKCNLKVKVVINASPFYYGAILMDYQPLYNFTPTTILDDTTMRIVIPRSQRPHCWIYPQKNAGAEMTLPFFNQRNMLQTQVAQDFDDMGKLDFTIVSPLQSANGAVGVGVTIQVYAWAEDVCVSGASVGLAMQSKDEYDTGPVSYVASAIAMAAGRLQSVPFIGKYMTATQIGASAIGRIASMFGFCNTPVITDIEPYKPNAFPPMASSEISFPVEKLTLDPKNELTVDPTSIGLPNDDELTVSYLTQKESYLVRCVWSNTAAVDELLFSTLVSPSLYDTGAGGNPFCYMTPVAWVSAMFGNWRGDLIFRFKFICSKFHRGRVRISYDPTGNAVQNILLDPVSTTVVFTEIVDINEDTNVEVRIPYQQATSFLKTLQSYSAANNLWSVSATPTLPAYDRVSHNGRLTVRVLTTLTAPTTVTDISMMVFVRAADNFELANPIDRAMNLSHFAVQSESVDDDTEIVHRIVAGSPSSPDPNRYLVHYGEVVTSLRQILHRYHYLENIGAAGTALGIAYLFEQFYRMPRYFGYDDHGVNKAVGLIVPGSSFKFNFVKTTPIQWLSPAFIATKGAINYAYNPASSTGNWKSHMRVSRVPYFSAGAASLGMISSAAVTNPNVRSQWSLVNLSGGSSGQALSNQRTNAGLNVSCPMYSLYNFETTNPANPTAPMIADGSDREMLVLEMTSDANETSTTVSCDKYVAAGTDFNLFFFLNVPTYKIYSAVPGPGT